MAERKPALGIVYDHTHIPRAESTQDAIQEGRRGGGVVNMSGPESNGNKAENETSLFCLLSAAGEYLAESYTPVVV
jgi:hypothetical protein